MSCEEVTYLRITETDEQESMIMSCGFYFCRPGLGCSSGGGMEGGGEGGEKGRTMRYNDNFEQSNATHDGLFLFFVCFLFYFVCYCKAGGSGGRLVSCVFFVSFLSNSFLIIRFLSSPFFCFLLAGFGAFGQQQRQNI